MSRVSWWRAPAIETHCTIEIEQTRDAFHAHTALDGDLELHPGDRVRVHGAPIRVGFGDCVHERRAVTVERAGPLARAWTRLAARLELTELFEVSFTARRSL